MYGPTSSQRIREAVYAQADGRCLSCGARLEAVGPRALHVDHVVPRIKGGIDHLDNYQALCRTCNLAKGSRSVDYRRRPARVAVAAKPVTVSSGTWTITLPNGGGELSRSEGWRRKHRAEHAVWLARHLRHMDATDPDQAARARRFIAKHGPTQPEGHDPFSPRTLPLRSTVRAAEANEARRP
jgi:hypothetical protein